MMAIQLRTFYFSAMLKRHEFTEARPITNSVIFSVDLAGSSARGGFALHRCINSLCGGFLGC